MRKVFAIIVFLLFLSGIAIGAVSITSQYVHKDSNVIYITQLLDDLSADDSAVALGDNLVGGYLFSVEIVSSADDAVTFSIDSGLGTTLFTRTTSAATSGEIANPTGYWPINSTPNYTLSGLGSGTVDIEITVVKK